MNLGCLHTLRALRGVALLLLVVPSAVVSASGQADAEIQGRVVDAEGAPLPGGTLVRGRVEWHWRQRDEPPLLMVNGQPEFDSVEIGPDGSFVVPRGSLWMDEAYTWWLHLERTLEDGARERVLVPAEAQVGTVAFEREALLARVRAADERGASVRDHAYGLELLVADPFGPFASERLSARWVRDGDVRELWGYRAWGEYSAVPRYVYHGPAGAPAPLPLDGSELTVVLPATGVLQLRVEAPRPFPERGVYFVIEDQERGTIHRRPLILNDVTNVRLLTGPHRVHYELYGEPLGEPEQVEIEHATTRRPATLDLRSRARVFAIEILGPEGQPIPGARVRVAGSTDPPAARQRVQRPDGSAWVILVATLDERVDLEIFDIRSGFVPRTLAGVNGDRVIVLEPAPIAERVLPVQTER